MTPWYSLLPISALMLAGSYLSYSTDHKSRPWLPFAMSALAATNGLIWGWAVARSSGRETYSLSVAWDVVTMVAYTGLPLLAFGVELSRTAWAGVGCVVLGACLVKWG